MTDAFYEALLADDVEDLYEDAPCGYLSTTPDGVVVKVNRTFLTWTDQQGGEVVGRRFPDLLTAGGRIFYETHIAPMLRMQGRVREIAVEAVCSDGRRLPVLVNAVLKRDDAGEPVVVRIAVFDATERRAYEAELLAARQRAEASEARARTLARTLQESLIPPEPPSIPGLDVAAAYRPAGAGDEVGGDYYDVFELAKDQWAVVLGDVCGKGADAATVTALSRYTIRAAAVQDPSPVHVLTTLNEAILRQRRDRFTTAVYLRIGLGGGTPQFELCVGGHLLPVHLRPGRPAREVGTIGTLLGAVRKIRLHPTSLELGPGESLVVFTDGFTEARHPVEGFFGDERFHALLQELSGASAAEIVEGSIDAAVAFQDGEPRDDLAVIVLRAPTAPTAPTAPAAPTAPIEEG
jgi:sigma-B regulation protein RsbU (phosphoserine phosphatase)